VEGSDTPLEVNRVDMFARAWASSEESKPWTCVVLGSDDGKTWTELGRTSGSPGQPETKWPFAREIKTTIGLSSASRRRFYRVQLDAANVVRWQVAEVALFDGNKQLNVGGPYDFTSAWKSAGNGEEWVYVDLGAKCNLERVVLYWIERAAEGAIQISDDAKTWRTIQTISSTGGAKDEYKLKQTERGRYVRLLMTRAVMPNGYVLSELEVYGRGGVLPRAQAAPKAKKDQRMDLVRGEWRIQRDSLVTAAYFRQSQTPLRLMSMVRFQSSSDCLTMGTQTPSIPALLKATSKRSNFSTAF